MGVEIERKFLIKNNSWQSEVNEQFFIQQGYLNLDSARTVRIRICGDKGVLTIKGKNKSLTRKEFEYSIPIDDALDLLAMCEQPIIEKTRCLVCIKNKTWEIDVFEGENKGLVLAEIELNSEDEQFDTPVWLGDEVSTDPKYYNSSLIQNPYSTWRSSFLAEG